MNGQASLDQFLALVKIDKFSALVKSDKCKTGPVQIEKRTSANRTSRRCLEKLRGKISSGKNQNFTVDLVQSVVK
jgi:hypothetical protein